MNLTEAYRLQNPNRVQRPTGAGIIRLTHELLETMLELPQGVWIKGIRENHERSCLDILIESIVPIEGITFQRNEAMRVPSVDIPTYIHLSQENPRPQQTIITSPVLDWGQINGPHSDTAVRGTIYSPSLSGSASAVGVSRYSSATVVRETNSSERLSRNDIDI